MGDDVIDKVITIGLGSVLAALLFGSLVLPTFNKLFGQLDAENAFSHIDDLDAISDLMWFILIAVAIGVVIAIVRYASNRER